MTRLLFPDNTVLINFAYISRMDLLQRLTGGNGAWCQSVAMECAKSAQIEGLEDLRGADEIFGQPWRPETGAEHSEIRRLREEMARPGDGASKHLGEAETIVLMERRASDGRFVTDDAAAARQAQAHGIASNTTWDLLFLALRLKWVDADTVYGYVGVLRQRKRPVPHTLWSSRNSFDRWATSADGTIP